MGGFIERLLFPGEKMRFLFSSIAMTFWRELQLCIWHQILRYTRKRGISGITPSNWETSQKLGGFCKMRWNLLIIWLLLSQIEVIYRWRILIQLLFPVLDFAEQIDARAGVYNTIQQAFHFEHRGICNLFSVWSFDQQKHLEKRKNPPPWNDEVWSIKTRSFRW